MGPQATMSSAQQQHPVETFDEAAFARAFEKAANEEAEIQNDTNQEQENHQNFELGQDILIKESAERLMADSAGLLDQERIGSDRIHDPLSQSPEARAQYEDPDALAKTAAELLDKVKLNQSSKFQNSQFLQLMQQFRSKEAIVQDDKLVIAGNVQGESMSQEAV